MAKTAIVTGGSSGIGLNVAKSLKEAGCKVYEFSRREVADSPFEHISVDVTDESAVQTAVGQILDAEGKIDILVNCAGFGIIERFRSQARHLSSDQVCARAPPQP